MKRSALAVVLLLPCLLLPAAAIGDAERPFSVLGEWFTCQDDGCFALDITENLVKSSRGTMCADVITTHVEEKLALVNCTASGKSMEMFFLFHAEDSATLWFSGDRPKMKALRRSKSPIPEKLLGEWVLEEWPQRSAKDSFQIQLKQNVARLNRGQREQVCEVIPLATEVPGGQNLFLECGRGEGIHLTLKEVSSGTYISTGDSRRGVGVLYRKDHRPSWFPSDYGQSSPDICEKVQGAAAREECYVSRGLCSRIGDPAQREECRLKSNALKALAATSEAKSNLGAIRSTEVAYFAEWNIWVGNQPPTPVADRRKNNERIPWVNNTRFSILGFAPEGAVYCSYSLGGVDYPAEKDGFQAQAICDLDGDGELSVWSVGSQDTQIRHSSDDY